MVNYGVWNVEVSRKLLTFSCLCWAWTASSTVVAKPARQTCLFKWCPYTKLGMHVSSVNHVLLFHITPLPACTYCGNFSSSVHVGALSQPFYTPVYHHLQYAKTEGESYHVTYSTGSKHMSSCLLSTAVMYMYDKSCILSYENGTNLAELHQTYPKIVTLLFVLPKQDYRIISNNSYTPLSREKMVICIL